MTKQEIRKCLALREAFKAFEATCEIVGDENALDFCKALREGQDKILELLEDN